MNVIEEIFEKDWAPAARPGLPRHSSLRSATQAESARAVSNDRFPAAAALNIRAPVACIVFFDEESRYVYEKQAT